MAPIRAHCQLYIAYRHNYAERCTIYIYFSKVTIPFAFLAKKLGAYKLLTNNILDWGTKTVQFLKLF